jgi:hypothetical protein
LVAHETRRFGAGSVVLKQAVGRQERQDWASPAVAYAAVQQATEIHENQFHKMIGPPVRATAFGAGEGRQKRRCHPRSGENAESGRPDVFDPDVN